MAGPKMNSSATKGTAPHERRVGSWLILMGIRALALGLLATCLFSHRPAGGGEARPAPVARTVPGSPGLTDTDRALARDWRGRWEKRILGDARNRYCDKAMGEDIGWLMRPFMDGFYCGYLATGDTRWVDTLVDWADSWIRRGVKGPDGYVGCC